MNKKLILIGYRGTGKTTLGRLLGRRLNLAVVDSDPEIERKTGKSIAAIFAEDGEAVFRDLEAETIAEILDRDEPLVLSTGGGAILRPETRQRLQEKGHVVWLTASAETISDRIRDDGASATTRPSLTGLPPLEEIVHLLETREPLYAKTAHQVVDTDVLALEEVVDLILAGPARMFATWRLKRSF